MTWTLRTEELRIADGWVQIELQSCAAASVTLGRPPTWWGRPIELLTPSGKLFVSVVPGIDLAVYAPTPANKEAHRQISAVLDAQRSVVPGRPPPAW